MSPRLLWAFLLRDLRIAASYPLSLLLVAVGGLITLTVFYFLAKTVGQPAALQQYGLDYFSFALVGFAVAACLRAVQTSFSQKLREAQTDGSLELLLAAPLRTVQTISLLALYPILSALLRSAALVGLGTLLGARVSTNPVGFGLTLLIAMLPFGALGLLSAAVVLTFKRGDPFTFALDAASYLLCGVIYPVEVLPPALQWVSRLLPATYALRALRATGRPGTTNLDLLPDWGILALFALVLWPAASAALSWARRRVEQTGTLPQW